MNEFSVKVFLHKKQQRKHTMSPEKLQGVLYLADLHQDYRLVDFKKYQRSKKITLVLERKRREGFCGSCGCLSDRIHAVNQVPLRDLPAFGYQIELIVERFHLRCEVCGIRVEAQSLNRPSRSFTWRYEQHVSRLCEETTNLAVARLEKLDDKTVYRIDYELLKMRIERQQLPELGPHYSMDEVYFRYFPNWHPSKEHSFVTNLACLTHKKIIANAPGRSEKSADFCFAWLTPEQRRHAQSIATDLHAAYHRSARKNLPNADIVLDRFHIMQMFSDAMNEFRKQQLSIATHFDEIYLLKGNNKRLLLAGPSKLSKTDQNLLDDLKKLNERVVDALIIRDHLKEFFESPTLRIAKVRWFNLLKLVREAGIKPITAFFTKLRKWIPDLWNYFHHKTSSATIEALNHKIKVVKASAYGYRNQHYFQLKILQRVGFLNTTWAPVPDYPMKSTTK